MIPRYIFFGGRESAFAQIILDSLIAAGMPPVEAVRDAKKPLDLDHLRSLNADFFVVAAFGKILKKDLLIIPPRGTIGIHPSLLPRYRGASPVQSVLLHDENETGTALFLIDEKVDNGPVLAEKKLAITDQDTYVSLIEKLARLSADLLIATMPAWLDDSLTAVPQDESKATFTRKFVTADAEVDLAGDPRSAWLKIRALNPEPGAFTVLHLKNGKDLRLKLLEADLADGRLDLKKVQPEGKKPMTYADFMNGYRDLIG
ncbi:MAG: hypothetical protein KGI60_00385 [Patescibacteria group bacterium]|nr:hypothetical protein [Patescibacteria group bacterium]